MYNKSAIDAVVSFIEENNRIADKLKLARMVQEHFSLTKDRSVFYSKDFSIRFSKAKTRAMSNTVLSLSRLQKYDNKPFLVCIVTHEQNFLLLANTTFLVKISQSSHSLRIDNIKGSFNGSDIMKKVGDLENIPANFEALFAFHCGFAFEDNLARLVESTNGIVGRVQKFAVPESVKEQIFNSVQRAVNFIHSCHFQDLKKDLDSRVKAVQGEIAIAAFIDNINLRGRIIEYLITDNGSNLKEQIIHALQNKTPLPEFTTEDKLGDYSKNYPAFHTETDIKTKVLFLCGNPKAYNIDKLLEFLASENSVYLIYLLGINDDGSIIAKLCSMFDRKLISATNIVHHWAGRNSRGVSQFTGTVLTQILQENISQEIDPLEAVSFLQKLIER